MKHRYLPMTDQDQADMLAAVGAETIDDLFADIPKRSVTTASSPCQNGWVSLNF